jgi:hypothetical protein
MHDLALGVKVPLPMEATVLELRVRSTSQYRCHQRGECRCRVIRYKASRRGLMRNYLLIGMLTCLVSVEATTLITNGSFESPVVPVGSFTNFASGSTGITGWTVVGP